ncbi:cytochrome c oxidase assembly protein [Bosea thiooxidans]
MLEHAHRHARPLVEEAAQGPLLAAALLFAFGALVAFSAEPGPLTIQMLLHLAAMNLVGVGLAAICRLRIAGVLWPAAALQMALLWAWHAPPFQQAIAGSALLQAFCLALLTAAATLFWAGVIEVGRRRRWGGLGALALTGKLACLLGVLMIFAGRDLYALPGLALAFCGSGPSSLPDQHLAGLLMVTACPLSYLVAGVWQAARTIGLSEDRPERGRRADGLG